MNVDMRLALLQKARNTAVCQFKILYLIIKTREVRTYTLLPRLIRILNIFGRFPALLFFIKKISEDFFIYGNERWGGGDNM